ncbi:MAG TPA: RiPP maturation radical SAM C-methyltransferase [Pyrinomonadaceae bacterium]|jgi:ribosomal peptide maturation radical SAM protein 1
MSSHNGNKKALPHKYTEKEESVSEVVLINMPFTVLSAPSIGLGLLKSGLTRLGIVSKSLNLNLRFAEMIGQDTYTFIEAITHPEQLVREWIFSESLFQHPKNRDIDGFVRDVLSIKTVDDPELSVYSQACLDKLVPAILKAKSLVEEFLDQCLETILALNPRVIGFTSIFEQHTASLSLARRIKSQRPDCFIIFGGSNCEGIMGAETFRQFDFIDVLVSGEGDLVFPEIVQSILESRPIHELPGVYNRRRRVLQIVEQPPQNTPPIEDLDKLPVPDYDDYFEQLEASSLKLPEEPTLFFETSRGCWWGEKLHCTFCGLNGATMAFRSKSAERALDELVYLTGRHPGCNVNVVDNILDMKYFKTLVKMLAEGDYNFSLFYEVKSNLRKEQLRLLREAGVTTIQPGIESLSDNILRIMRKGVTALQNIQLLKWCSELNIKAVYNIIWGFPGESPDDYKKMLELIPAITHLRPPVGAGTIRIDRFSPNFNSHKELGFTQLTPFPAYRYVYPLDPKAVHNLAYFFVPEYENLAIERSITRGLSEEIKKWGEIYDQSELFFIDKGTQLLIWDFRPCAQEPLIILDEYSRLVYLACDEAKTINQIHNSWHKTPSAPLDKVRLKESLDRFVDQSLMIKEGEQYLSLAYCKSTRTLD